jgi:hypothetical protein
MCLFHYILYGFVAIELSYSTFIIDKTYLVLLLLKIQGNHLDLQSNMVLKVLT